MEHTKQDPIKDTHTQRERGVIPPNATKGLQGEPRQPTKHGGRKKQFSTAKMLLLLR